MQTIDIGRCVLIIVVFLLLYFYNLLGVGLSKIEKNWPVYRCNPIVIPFAGVFGHDAVKNFTFCIQNMQLGFMGHLLHPLHYNFSLIETIVHDISRAVNDVRKFFFKLRSMIANMCMQIFTIFLNIIVAFQRMIIGVSNTFGKLTGMMVTIIYTVGGTMITAKSLYDGPPGKLLKDVAKFACFAPDTPVTLTCGRTLAMKDVPLGAVLSNGAKVRAVMQIQNPDKREIYYDLDGIHVTGNHLVYDLSKHSYIHVKDSPDARVSSRPADEELSCLVTTNNTIPIGSRLFHDWDDNQS